MKQATLWAFAGGLMCGAIIVVVWTRMLGMSAGEGVYVLPASLPVTINGEAGALPEGTMLFGGEETWGHPLRRYHVEVLIAQPLPLAHGPVQKRPLVGPTTWEEGTEVKE